MEFKKLNEILAKHVAGLAKDEAHLFVVEVDKDALWNTYLDSFPPGTNEVFRKQREFDCSSCRGFVKTFGNVVRIGPTLRVDTIWDFEVDDPKYRPVLEAMSTFVRSKPITDVFVTDTRVFGVEKSYEAVPAGVGTCEAKTWTHFHAVLPKNFAVYADLNQKRGELRDIRNVFKRSLEEISGEALDAVLDLVAQGSLYKGEEWAAVLQKFATYRQEHGATPAACRENYCWRKSLEAGPVIGKIRNHSIGVLLLNLSAGMDIDEAVRKYEQIVAPTNYKRPKAIFTKRMIEDAQKKLHELGLEGSLGRRHAHIDDITVPNVLFANRSARAKMAGDVFEELASESAAPISPKKFDRLEEVGISQFVEEILPRSTSVDLFLENRHAGNLVSLVAPADAASPSLFKWGNGFSWAYRGNITDSMKERVKSAGGKVDGVLRFSIQWNENGDNLNDFDAHCLEPNGNRIWFRQKTGHSSKGMLDVDIIHPQGVAVENITWPDRVLMHPGIYAFMVHNYTHRGGRSGFRAEIEFDGQLFEFSYDQDVRQSEAILVAEVELLRSGEFKLHEKLPSATSSRELWGLRSNQFYPASVVMYSPNYWDAQTGIGHRHYFFMLNGCRSDEAPNGFFNEFLREEFMVHKRVFEALGAKMRVAADADQLSGLGFSATKHDSFVVRVEGAFKRTLKVVI